MRYSTSIIQVRDILPQMQIFRIHVNSWFILYRSAKIALRLVQKLGRDKQYKMYQKFVIFLPLLPPIYICQNFTV